MIIEKICADDVEESTTVNSSNQYKSIFYSIKIIGILNMLANIVDNFTHGIAVAGSFQASHKVNI